uniref:Anhydro-N-acetylmuramic acid kinase n=1 Tax=uncultured Alphaproteobacteria bacterium TaxID=91750 RepID=A0A6G8F2J6_9PROT|nr:anhydro-N-acetylmuramic acid kinase [uncultured Alphaproteobacteria bacterium]
MGNIKTVSALGIMSSTSYEGVGIAKIETDGVDVKAFGPAYITPFDESLIDALRKIDGCRADDSPDAANAIRRTEIAFTEFCADLVQNFLTDNSCEVDVIGFAGHTICHNPAEHYTHQIGDGKMLAELTGIQTVSGFRNADILNGGQGAPFSPVYYEALTSCCTKPLVVIDIGGTTDISWFGANGEMMAFVSGPGNAVINDWVMKHGGMHIDYNGRLAILGKVNEQILSSLMHHKYLALQPPKACGRAMFNEKMEHLEGLSLEDGAATATAFVAESIAYSIALYLPEPPQEVFVCGGGAKNPTLLRFLRQRLPELSVKTTAEKGWNVDAIDAQAAAFWAVRRLHCLPVSFPFTTGVPVPCICGELFGNTNR